MRRVRVTVTTVTVTVTVTQNPPKNRSTLSDTLLGHSRVPQLRRQAIRAACKQALFLDASEVGGIIHARTHPCDRSSLSHPAL